MTHPQDVAAAVRGDGSDDLRVLALPGLAQRVRAHLPPPAPPT